MSHFGTLVCLPADTKMPELEAVLDNVMARWDENREVEPYRDYETDAPQDATAVWYIRSQAEHHRNGTGVLPYEPDMLGWSSASSKLTPDEQRAKFAEAAKIEATFPEVITWEFAARFTNEHYNYEPDNPSYLHLDEDGRAYTLSTLNPERKWDYWRIGGRWRNYFVAREAVPNLIRSERSWDSPAEGPVVDRLRVDGGPIGSLDFDVMRDEWAATQLARFDRWREIVAEHGEPPAWRDLMGLRDLGEMDMDTARRTYNTHPAIVEARNADISGWGEGPEEEFGTTREEFERLARLAAVPSYALVTLDGEWMAPGQMGWFGMSSDEAGEREAYRIEANRYLESLDPSVLLVVLDLHI